MSGWLLFLTVFASLAVGWFIGRYQGLLQFKNLPSNPISSKYFKGLNYLINEQPDQAIHHFITLVEADSESIELQLVLAKLFRKKGELERAITLHQRLLARPDLALEQRQRITIELAEDYYSAGLHDRAEQLLEETLSEHPSKDAIALLFSIWEAHKDWSKVVISVDKMKSLPDSLAKRVVGACCELSLQHPEEAYHHLNHAERYFQDSVMLQYFYAEVHLRMGNKRKALKRLRKLITLDQSMIPLALPLLKRCFEGGSLWMTSLRSVLEDWYELNPSISVVKELLDVIHQEDGFDAALIFLTEYLKIRPSIPGLVQLVDLHLKLGAQHDQATMTMFRNLCAQIVEERSQYQCQKCGYQSQRMYWHCPNCRKWESIRPVYGLDAE